MMKLITKKHSLVTCKLRMAGQLKDVPPKWLILYVLIVPLPCICISSNHAVSLFICDSRRVALCNFKVLVVIDDP